MTVTLAAVFVYPVKALRGVALDRASVRRPGIDLDREWMIVDARGHSVTQIEQPRLACIDVSLGDDALLLHAPGMPPLVLPQRRVERRERDVKLFRRARRAFGVSEDADRWFSDFLGLSCALVRMRPDDGVSFANQRPFHLVSRESWQDLAARVAPAELPVSRFRPNFVVAGASAYDEDGWSAVTVGSRRFRVIEPCVRCAVTCVDANTGTRGVEPLRTLAGFRAVRTLAGRRVHFGVYAALQDEGGTVSVGDVVSLG